MENQEKTEMKEKKWMRPETKTALIAVGLLLLSLSVGCLYLINHSNQIKNSGLIVGGILGLITGGTIGGIVGGIVRVIVGGILVGIIGAIVGGLVAGSIVGVMIAAITVVMLVTCWSASWTTS